MAERARAKKKTAAKKRAAPKGGQASRGRVAKTEPAAGIGHNSGRPSPALIKDHHDKINGIEHRVKAAKAKYDQLRGELRSAYSVVKQDNIDVDDFKLSRELDKRDHGEVVTGYANVGYYLAAIKSPLAEQMDLFQALQPAMAKPALAGAHAFQNSEPRTNNPHKAGSADYAEWDESWMTAANNTDLQDGDGQTIN